jgi:hypothetical protein
VAFTEKTSLQRTSHGVRGVSLTDAVRDLFKVREGITGFLCGSLSLLTGFSECGYGLLRYCRSQLGLWRGATRHYTLQNCIFIRKFTAPALPPWPGSLPPFGYFHGLSPPPQGGGGGESLPCLGSQRATGLGSLPPGPPPPRAGRAGGGAVRACLAWAVSVPQALRTTPLSMRIPRPSGIVSCMGNLLCAGNYSLFL